MKHSKNQLIINQNQPQIRLNLIPKEDQIIFQKIMTKLSTVNNLPCRSADKFFRIILTNRADKSLPKIYQSLIIVCLLGIYIRQGQIDHTWGNRL